MLEYLLLFSKLYIVFLIFLMVIGMLTNLKVGIKGILLLGVLFIFSFSIIAYATIPHDSDDLTRYFYWIQAMKGRDIKFAFSVSPFSTTIISNMLLYIVSVIGDEHFLPAVSVAIDFSCILYIIINEKNRKKISTRMLISYIVICIGVVGLYSRVSGIRYDLAASIASVVIYNDFIRNKKGIKTIIGYAVLPFIHLSTITILVVRLLYEYKLFKKIKFIFLFIPIIFGVFQTSLTMLRLPFLQPVFEKVNIYKGVVLAGQSFQRNIGYILFNLLFYILLVLITRSVNKKGKIQIESGDSEFISFMTLYSLFCMGTYFVIPESFYRGTSVIAILILPVFELFTRYRKSKFSIIISAFYVVCIGIFYIYEYILFYSKWIIVIK